MKSQHLKPSRIRRISSSVHGNLRAGRLLKSQHLLPSRIRRISSSVQVCAFELIFPRFGLRWAMNSQVPDTPRLGYHIICNDSCVWTSDGLWFHKAQAPPHLGYPLNYTNPCTPLLDFLVFLSFPALAQALRARSQLTSKSHWISKDLITASVLESNLVG